MILATNVLHSSESKDGFLPALRVVRLVIPLSSSPSRPVVPCTDSPASPRLDSSWTSSRSTLLLVARGTFSQSSPLCIFEAAVTSLTTFAPSLSTPFQAPQPLHLHRPNSSNVLTPGGACPLTSRQFEQSNTSLFLAAVSSSPSMTSRIRSYQWWACSYAVLGGGTLVKAFGANPGASGLMSAGLWAIICAASGGWPCAVDIGLVSTCGLGVGGMFMFLPGIFAVGGGGIPVLCGVGRSDAGSAFRFDPWCGCLEGAFVGGAPPYFCSSSCVLSYLVAFFKSAIFASLCFCKWSRCNCCRLTRQSKKVESSFLTA